MIRSTVVAVAAVLGAYAVFSATFASGAPVQDAGTAAVLARGRYLVVFGGCNDCHTPGWSESDGTLPESAWLTGNRIGFRGAWGTSYPVNLRRDFQMIGEDQWQIAVRTRGGHPPMRWHDLRILNAADRHAIYSFIKSLGPAGVPAPAALPPWREPTTPYIETRPRAPHAGAAPLPDQTP